MVRLAVLMATEEKPYETFLEKSFSLFDPDLGDERCYTILGPGWLGYSRESIIIPVVIKSLSPSLFIGLIPDILALF